MESNWAAENLQTIRTLMERSAIYRRALAPISTYVGVVGILGAMVGWGLQVESTRAFALYWMGISLVALAGAFVLVRRQSVKDGEPFWSPPTRRVIQAMLPALTLGMFLGVFIALEPWAANNDDFRQIELVLFWVPLYGLALHSAGFFMPSGVRLFGWAFIGMAAGLIICSRFAWIWPKSWSLHFMMGILFGASHLAYGIYLYFTEPGKNEA